MIEGARPSISFRRSDGAWVPVEAVEKVSIEPKPISSEDSQPIMSWANASLTGTIKATIDRFTLRGVIERYTITHSRNFVRHCARVHLSNGARFTWIDGWSTRKPRRLRRRERKRKGKV